MRTMCDPDEWDDYCEGLRAEIVADMAGVTDALIAACEASRDDPADHADTWPGDHDE